MATMETGTSLETRGEAGRAGTAWVLGYLLYIAYDAGAALLPSLATQIIWAVLTVGLFAFWVYVETVHGKAMPVALGRFIHTTVSTVAAGAVITIVMLGFQQDIAVYAGIVSQLSLFAGNLVIMFWL